MKTVTSVSLIVIALLFISCSGSIDKSCPCPKLDETLKQEYIQLFNTCIPKPEKIHMIDNRIDEIVKNKDRYERACQLYNFNLPWYFVGLFHSLESDLSFKGHYHNGDPLTERTINVPEDRPKDGNPPFTWEESFKGAVIYDRLNNSQSWDLSNILYKLERFNGCGYRCKPFCCSYFIICPDCHALAYF